MKSDGNFLFINTEKAIDKKLFILAKNISIFFKIINVSRLPIKIEKWILKSNELLRKLRINNIWYFSQRKKFSFLSLINSTDNRILVSKIIKFSIQKELAVNKFKESFRQKKFFLILNNFIDCRNSNLFINSFFKNLFGVEKKRTDYQNISKIFFVDFNEKKKILEFRFYNTTSSNILLDRNCRKNKIKACQVSKKKNQLNNGHWSRKKFLRIKEIGPRITVKILELLN